jgi:hypothetical protein
MGSMAKSIAGLLLAGAAFAASSSSALASASALRPGSPLAHFTCGPFQWVDEGGKAKVAMRVPVTINGRTYSLQLDTGSNATILYGDEAARRRWAKAGATSFDARTIRVGGIAMANREITILPDMEASGGGTLGLDLLLGRVVVLDYPHRRFCLTDAGALPRWVSTNARWSNAALRNGKLFVPVRIGGESFPQRFLFDTGSSSFAMAVEKSRWAELTGKGKTAAAAITGTQWGKPKVWPGAQSLKPIEIGNEDYPTLPIHYEDYGFYTSKFDADGLVGNAPFLDKIVLLDLGPDMRFGVIPGTTDFEPLPDNASWSQRAVADLRAIHQYILDNHPGPVDAENPAFKNWLEQGYQRSLELARAAKRRGEYNRAVSSYTNGFADDHLGLLTNFGSVASLWPGFLTTFGNDGQTRVTVAEPKAPVSIGDELISCDGVPAAELTDKALFRVYADPGIPHLRPGVSVALFAPAADDPQRWYKRCLFRHDGRIRTVTPHYRPISPAMVSEKRTQAHPYAVPAELGIHEVDGVWFVSIPSFQWYGEGAALYQKFLDDLSKHADVLHEAPMVIIDVRGNGGGDSNLAQQAAEIMFGKKLVDDVANSFDWTVDWRASPHNLAMLRHDSLKNAVDGHEESAKSRGRAADLIAAALARGEPLAREASPPTSKGAQGEPSPFKGKVYFLTSGGSCGSSCLDFADIVLRMPGVTHIGDPTYADAVYIDVALNPEPLPSGRAALVSPLKVYRNRVRANNQFYTPKIAWPDDKPMTTEAVAAWVKRL